MTALAQTVDRPAGPVYKQGAAQQPGKANRSTFSVSQRDAIERAGALRGQRGRAQQPYSGPVVVAPTKQRGPGYGLAGVLRTRRPRAKDSRGKGDSLLFLRDREHAKLVKRAQEVRQSAADRCRRASRIHRQRRKPTDDDAYHMRPKWDTHLERCVREGRIDELWQPKAKPPRETFEGPPPAHVDAPHTMDPGDKLYPAPRHTVDVDAEALRASRQQEVRRPRSGWAPPPHFLAGGASPPQSRTAAKLRQCPRCMVLYLAENHTCVPVSSAPVEKYDGRTDTRVRLPSPRTSAHSGLR